MAVSALYTGAAPSARHDGVEPRERALYPRKFWVAWERGAETTGDPVAYDWDFWAERRQRRSKSSSAAIASAPCGRRRRCRWSPGAVQADRV